MNVIMLINVKIPTIVGILTFIHMIQCKYNIGVSLKALHETGTLHTRDDTHSDRIDV